jgi:hypothetical protein
LFRPVQLHLQSANLFEQRLFLYLAIARLPPPAIHEYIGQLLHRRFAPVADLHIPNDGDQRSEVMAIAIPN